MPDFDVEDFVAKLDRMGMKLTAVPLADGTLRINRWRMLSACEHVQQIQDLWAAEIGNSQERIDILAAHLDEVAPRAVGYGASSDRTRNGSQSRAAADAALARDTAPDPRKTAASQSGATPRKPRRSRTAMRALTAAASQSVAALQRVVEKAASVSIAGPQNAPGPDSAVGVKNAAGTPSTGGRQSTR